MPTYTYTQLSNGVVTNSLSGAITAQFENPSGSAYFFLVQNSGSNENTGFYPENTTSYTTGSFSSLSNISESSIVENKFKFGVSVPEGTSSMVFTPNNTDGVTNAIILRGTGMFACAISNVVDPLFLDTYGTNVKVAYSLRKLSSTYSGPAIRVREGLFNTETDIGFDSDGNLDEAALLSHCSSNGTGFIAKWYDQSGNGGDLVQGTNASQPQIVSGNAVLKVNGKPVMRGADNGSTGTTLPLSGTKSTYFPTTGQYYFFSVSKVTNDRAILYRENTRFQLIAQDSNSSTAVRDATYSSNTYRKNGSTYSPTNRGEVYTSFNSQHLLTINGSLDHTVNSFVLGYGTSRFANWDMQEFIVYEGDKASDQSNIETAINGYYSIY